jgi:hypothetical protein
MYRSLEEIFSLHIVPRLLAMEERLEERLSLEEARMLIGRFKSRMRVEGRSGLDKISTKSPGNVWTSKRLSFMIIRRR